MDITIDVVNENRDCVNYDWGDTAPSAYGAFCKRRESHFDLEICQSCEHYKYLTKEN